MFCNYCGAQIDDESTFCSKCGKALFEKTIQDVKENSESVKKKFPKPVIIISIGIALVIIIAIIVYNNMVGITIVNKNVEAGSVVMTEDLVKAKSDTAKITISGEVDTDTLGDKSITCTIQNGIFKASKDITVHVVDTTAPIITGP